MERKKEKTKNTWRIFLSCLIFAFSFLMILATTSWASGTNTVTVKAKVLGNCVFTTTTSTLDFGDLNANNGSNVTASSTVNIKCTKKASFSIASDNGQHYGDGSKRMQAITDPAEFIKYSLGVNPSDGQGQGMGVAIPITVTGTIAYSDYQNAIADSFQDTIILTVTP
jgi:spore coat protein U-like protein